MAQTGVSLLTDKTIASQVAAMRKEGRTVQQIANAIGRDRRVVELVIKTCISSGLLTAEDNELPRNRNRSGTKRSLTRSAHQLGDWDW